MGVDYAEKEREFLDGLAEDTGRDLAGWMAAISETKLEDRNAIIDWLRQQGFLFAKASWLERIHHNGGRPIYFDPAQPGKPAAPQSQPRAVQVPAPTDRDLARPPIERRPGSAPPVAISPPRPAGASLAGPSLAGPSLAGPSLAGPTLAGAGEARPALPRALAKEASPSLDALLADAKGYRPLAQLLMREIEAVVPDTTFEAANGYVAIMRDGRCAGVLTLSAKELRLALAGGAQTMAAPFERARFTKSHDNVPASMTHMIILGDARQITPDLIAAVGRVLCGS